MVAVISDDTSTAVKSAFTIQRINVSFELIQHILKCRVSGFTLVQSTHYPGTKPRVNQRSQALCTDFYNEDGGADVWAS